VRGIKPYGFDYKIGDRWATGWALSMSSSLHMWLQLLGKESAEQQGEHAQYSLNLSLHLLRKEPTEQYGESMRNKY
jgi:hypothetical protein